MLHYDAIQLQNKKTKQDKFKLTNKQTHSTPYPHKTPTKKPKQTNPTTTNPLLLCYMYSHITCYILD